MIGICKIITYFPQIYRIDVVDYRKKHKAIAYILPITSYLVVEVVAIIFI
jgi:hypothetical protein